MKLYKPTYQDRTGKKKECKTWHCTFVDNRLIRRRLGLYTDKRSSEREAEKIEQLLSSNGVLDRDQQKWIEGLRETIRNKLIGFGLIDSRKTSHLGKPLTDHLVDFHAALLAKENGRRYADQVKSRVEHIFTQCGFRIWSDIDSNSVYTYLADLRGEPGIGIGQRAFNYYLKSCKQFCKWMLKERRASANPLAHLGCIKQTETRRRRRALSLNEQHRLLESITGTHHNLTAYERNLVYRLALQTGLRANELRHLTKDSFDFNENTVTVEAGYSKNKQQAVIELKRQMAVEIKTYVVNKLPQMRVFAIPHKPADMLKVDLAEAGIPYRNDAGQVADFHSLRHSFITNLARQGVHPKDAQVLARHSTITLTMDYYTHTERGSLRKIIEQQPDLTFKKAADLTVA